MASAWFSPGGSDLRRAGPRHLSFGIGGHGASIRCSHYPECLHRAALADLEHLRLPNANRYNATPEAVTWRDVHASELLVLAVHASGGLRGLPEASGLLRDPSPKVGGPEHRVGVLRLRVRDIV